MISKAQTGQTHRQSQPNTLPATVTDENKLLTRELYF